MVAVAVAPESLPFDLQPGDFVDVYMRFLFVDTGEESQPGTIVLPLTQPVEGQTPEMVEQRILEHVEVVQVEMFSTASNTDAETNPVIVTLAVSPQDALVLTWAADAQIPVWLVAAEDAAP
jgi:Flp pilus assembly protein CpaB